MKDTNKYTLLVLAAIFAVAQLDRQILGISLDAIGQEFDLSDTQLGLLSGLVFALVFALAGFPIAWLAATKSRRNIVAASAFFWSLMTLATSAAQNFTHLIIARLGVGVGEAGAVSPAHSMISDLYPVERRTSAMATFVVGANVGILLAFLIGGVIGNAFGWRWAFIVASIPGLVLAIVLRMTVAEPHRSGAGISGGSPSESGFSGSGPSERAGGSLFIATWKTIWQDKALFHALWGFAITGIVTFGALAWNPTFIIRVHDLNQAETGIYLALTIGVIGGVGTWLSGWTADRLGAADARWRIGVVVIAIVIAKPFTAGFLLVDHRVVALSCFVVSAFVAGVFWGPTFALLHSRVEVSMRPMATAIFVFMFNLVGVGVGPTVVGIASDTVFSDPGSGTGSTSLGLSLLVIQIVGLWGAWHYWKALGYIDRQDHRPDPGAARNIA